MSYPVTPTLSVAAVQERVALEEVLPVDWRPLGAVGAWVSVLPPGPSRLMSSA